MINSQLLFYIYIGSALLIIFYFWIGRPKQRTPVKLNLHAKESQKMIVLPEEESLPIIKTNPLLEPVAHKKLEKNRDVLVSQNTDANFRFQDMNNQYENPLQKEEVIKSAVESKSLSVFFMYNGHDWEAHEILGVPHGASMKFITQVYQEQIKNKPTEGLEFREAAYLALSEHHKKHRL